MTASPQDWAWSACCHLIGAPVSFDAVGTMPAAARRAFLALLFALYMGVGGGS